MKNLKKLNKRELRTIVGGKEMCIDPATGECMKYGRGCAEQQCQLIIIDPIDRLF
ncbi:hypothetical protein NZD88_02720 [Chryseobacterium antibioticum]|uniref:Bacteriocin-type signal sequence-containing protein n=2 Tax=Chryseobacterium TaxID=59732 RepID=A0A7Y0AM69_9FLAO|nr:MULTISPECIES: hypothetical protein [Chryseobacterium]MCT2406468.1 hypothetical protein [Chryseobacterium pyrolae]NML69933.1 hypothetical protein [Chryseobacterium antibioticum]